MRCSGAERASFNWHAKCPNNAYASGPLIAQQHQGICGRLSWAQSPAGHFDAQRRHHEVSWRRLRGTGEFMSKRLYLPIYQSATLSICISIYLSIYLFIHPSIHPFLYIYMYINIYIYIYIYLHTYRIFIYINIYVHARICIKIIYVYVNTYVYICVYIYTYGTHVICP